MLCECKASLSNMSNNSALDQQCVIYTNMFASKHDVLEDVDSDVNTYLGNYS